jgi:hypothetical protein
LRIVRVPGETPSATEPETTVDWETTDPIEELPLPTEEELPVFDQELPPTVEGELPPTEPYFEESLPDETTTGETG